ELTAASASQFLRQLAGLPVERLDQPASANDGHVGILQAGENQRLAVGRERQGAQAAIRMIVAVPVVLEECGGLPPRRFRAADRFPDDDRARLIAHGQELTVRREGTGIELVRVVVTGQTRLVAAQLADQLAGGGVPELGGHVIADAGYLLLVWPERELPNP